MQINWPNKITRWHDKNQWQFWLFRPLLWVYRVVCHGFRLTERNDYCQVNFDSFRSNHHFLRQLEPEAKPPLWILAKLSLSKSMILTVEFQKPIAFSIYQTSLWSSPTSHSIIIRRERTNQTKIQLNRVWQCPAFVMIQWGQPLMTSLIFLRHFKPIL